MEKTASEWATLLTVDDPQQVDKAANALAICLGRTPNMDLLHTLMQHPDDGVRSAVAWAMEEAHVGRKSLQPILQGLHDQSHRVRYWCARSLRTCAVERRVEAILHLFTVLEDDADDVRFAAADAIHTLSGDFPAAIAADPIAFGITGEKAARVLQTQERLRLGYSALATESVDRLGGVASDWLSQVGLSIGVKLRWKEVASLTNHCLQTFLPDARCVLVRHLGHAVTDVVEDVSSLTSDSEPSVRKRAGRH